jgi:hypothetical protein
MSLLSAIRRGIACGLKVVLCIFLLTFYIAGTSQLETLHQFFHSHDHLTSHSEAQEKNPCHREIFHHDIEKGCGHGSHIVVRDKCELCDVTFHIDQIFLARSGAQSIIFFSVDFVDSSPDAVGLSQSNLSSRAPPAI